MTKTDPTIAADFHELLAADHGDNFANKLSEFLARHRLYASNTTLGRLIQEEAAALRSDLYAATLYGEELQDELRRRVAGEAVPLINAESILYHRRRPHVWALAASIWWHVCALAGNPVDEATVAAMGGHRP